MQKNEINLLYLHLPGGCFHKFMQPKQIPYNDMIQTIILDEEDPYKKKFQLHTKTSALLLKFDRLFVSASRKICIQPFKNKTIVLLFFSLER